MLATGAQSFIHAPISKPRAGHAIRHCNGGGLGGSMVDKLFGFLDLDLAPAQNEDMTWVDRVLLVALRGGASMSAKTE